MCLHTISSKSEQVQRGDVKHNDVLKKTKFNASKHASTWFWACAGFEPMLLRTNHRFWPIGQASISPILKQVLRPCTHDQSKLMKTDWGSVSSVQTYRVYGPSDICPSDQSFKTCFKIGLMDWWPIGQNQWLVRKSIGSKPAHAQKQVYACLEALNFILFSTSLCFTSPCSDTIVFLTDGV